MAAAKESTIISGWGGESPSHEIEFPLQGVPRLGRVGSGAVVLDLCPFWLLRNSLGPVLSDVLHEFGIRWDQDTTGDAWIAIPMKKSASLPSQSLGEGVARVLFRTFDQRRVRKDLRVALHPMSTYSGARIVVMRPHRAALVGKLARTKMVMQCPWGRPWLLAVKRAETDSHEAFVLREPLVESKDEMDCLSRVSSQHDWV